MKRSLIVGASSQVGRQLSAILGTANIVPTTRRKNVPGWTTLDPGFLGQHPGAAETVVRNAAVDVVYYVGGATNVEACETDPTMAMQANCEGPAQLAAAAAASGLPFVYFSTEYVFDGMAGPYEEDVTPNPISQYGRSKWQGELAVADAHPQPLILRTTVVYGPDPGGKNFLCGLRRALIAGQTFRVPNDQISTPTYNLDLAKAAVELVALGATGVFHACGPERLSRLEFAQSAATLMGLDSSLIYGAPTSDLGQLARRPLNAGLVTTKLSSFYPGLRIRPLKDAIRDWAGDPGFPA